MKYICGSGFPTYPIFQPYPKALIALGGTLPQNRLFSDFDAIFFVKCLNKIK